MELSQPVDKMTSLLPTLQNNLLFKCIPPRRDTVMVLLSDVQELLT